MGHKIHVAAFVATVALIGPTWAQAQTSTGSTSTATTSTTSSSSSGSFQSLSPGNQKIARALFDAQQPTASGPAPLSLNQIADRKAGTGWGEVFKQMKSDGLVDEKNLGQVVSNYEHANNVHGLSGTGHTGATVAVTTGSGRTVTTGSGHSSSSGASAHGQGDDGQHVSNTTSVTTAGGSTVGASSGASVVHGGGGGNGGVGGAGSHGR